MNERERAGCSRQKKVRGRALIENSPKARKRYERERRRFVGDTFTRKANKARRRSLLEVDDEDEES